METTNNGGLQRVPDLLSGRRALIAISSDQARRCRFALALERCGVSVWQDHRLDCVQRALEREEADLIVSDGLPPELDVASFVKMLRARDREVALIMTLREDDATGRVLCLELGADDCMTLGADSRELAARAQSLFGRIVRPRERLAGVREVPMVFGDYRVDPVTRTVTCGGERIRLSDTEYALLWALLRRHGLPVTRDRLMREIRGRAYTPGDRTIDVLITRLRRKLEAVPSQPRFIQTARGVGYMLVAAGTAGQWRATG